MQILIIKEFVDRLKYNLLITNPVQIYQLYIITRKI
jgi:hypothetical protein